MNNQFHESVDLSGDRQRHMELHGDVTDDGTVSLYLTAEGSAKLSFRDLVGEETYLRHQERFRDEEPQSETIVQRALGWVGLR
jgi:hypothetical protein